MKIIWTLPAIEELEGIRDYIAQDSAYYADNFVERAVEAVESLARFPRIGRVVPEARRSDIREILFHAYRIIYQVAPDGLYIISVIHGSRDLKRKKPRPWDVT